MLRLLPEMGSGAVLVGSVGLLCALLAAFGHASRGQKIWLLLAPGPIGVPYLVIGALVVILLFNLKPVANILYLSGAAFGLLYAELAGRTWRPLARRRRASSNRFGEIEIAKDGQVRVHVKGAKGEQCLRYVEFLSKVVGPVSQSRLTEEYYEPAGPRHQFGQGVC